MLGYNNERTSMPKTKLMERIDDSPVNVTRTRQIFPLVFRPLGQSIFLLRRHCSRCDRIIRQNYASMQRCDVNHGTPPDRSMSEYAQNREFVVDSDEPSLGCC